MRKDFIRRCWILKNRTPLPPQKRPASRAIFLPAASKQSLRVRFERIGLPANPGSRSASSREVTESQRLAQRALSKISKQSLQLQQSLRVRFERIGLPANPGSRSASSREVTESQRLAQRALSKMRKQSLPLPSSAKQNSRTTFNQYPQKPQSQPVQYDPINQR